MRRVLTLPSIYTDAYETFEDEAKALAPGRVRTGLRKVLQNTDIKVGKYAGSSRVHCTALRKTNPCVTFGLHCPSAWRAAKRALDGGLASQRLRTHLPRTLRRLLAFAFAFVCCLC